MKRIARFLSLAFVAMLIALPVHATVSSETTRVKYTCDGTTTVYAYPFKIYENDDILAVKALTSTGAETTLVLNTDYTVSGAGGAGGNVTLTAGSVCGSGYTLTILRNIELTQETDYVDGQAFSAESLESAIDKVTLIQQQQEEKIGRAPKLPKTSSITDIALPNPSANNYIGWNAGATNLENKATPVITTATQYEIDALVSYGNGTSYTQATILSALTAIGTTNKVTLLLRPGTWVISTDADYHAYTNVTWKVPPGALLQIAPTKTLTIYSPANIEANVRTQIFSGSGVVRFSVGGDVSPLWYPGADIGAQINAASQSLPANLAAYTNVSGDGRVIVPSQPYDKDDVTFTGYTAFSTTINLEPGVEVDFNHARLRYTGTGIAVSNQYKNEKDFRAKNIYIVTSHTSIATRAGKTGVQLNSASFSNISIDKLLGFEKGVVLRADPEHAVRPGGTSDVLDSPPCAYNKITIGSIYGTTYPIVLESVQVDPPPYHCGWVNQNQFIRSGSGGLILDGANSLIGIQLLLIDGPTVGNTNLSYMASNTFTNFNLETWPKALYIQGTANTFREIYTEGATTAVEFGILSQYNNVYFNRSTPTTDQAVIDSSVVGNNVHWKDDFQFWKDGWSPKNLLANADFDFWNTSTSLPRWSTGGTALALTRESTIKRRTGGYSLKLTSTDGVAQAYQTLSATLGATTIGFLSGKTLTASVWAYQTEGNLSYGDARIHLQAVGDTTVNAYSKRMLIFDVWEQSRASIVLPANCTEIYVYLEIYSSNTTYWDSASLIVGEQVPLFTPRVVDETDLIYYKEAWEVGSIADGDKESKDFTVNGAALGDWVQVANVIDIAGLILTAHVKSANTITATYANNTGAPVDLVGANLHHFRVIKNIYQ